MAYKINFLMLNHLIVCRWCFVCLFMELLIKSKSSLWFFHNANVIRVNVWFLLNHFDIVSLFICQFLWEILYNRQSIWLTGVNYMYIFGLFLNHFNVTRIRFHLFLWEILYDSQSNFMSFIWINFEIMNFFFLLSLNQINIGCVTFIRLFLWEILYNSESRMLIFVLILMHLKFFWLLITGGLFLSRSFRLLFRFDFRIDLNCSWLLAHCSIWFLF